MPYPGFESAEEALKVKYRPLFLAIRQTLHDWPGGSSEIFRMLNRNVHRSWNQFNPANYECAPGLLLTLELLEYTRSRRIAHELAALADCITLPCSSARAAAPSTSAAAEHLAAAMRKILYNLDTITTLRTQADRQSARDDLRAIIEAAHVLMMRLNG